MTHDGMLLFDLDPHWRHGRRIATHLLKIYETRSGDRADPHLVAFYRSVRACIRIRLAAHRLADATAAQWRRRLERIDQYLTCIEKL
ncbi:hypothetical protein FZ983_24640 [Azospirillum sp. B21]|uniref:hypothetical protein n=1 Tax=Azospirillum sp. B21 TaxID=2607496 RepID=UPI0011EE18FA|nr:hypothetical protein [Azospirillum sp. B21]KAA0575756.1 hypothetical protein FZ983_24640 [Azospirillum sp. B21]